jgi:hypothetical protein
VKLTCLHKKASKFPFVPSSQEKTGDRVLCLLSAPPLICLTSCGLRAMEGQWIPVFTETPFMANLKN